MTDISIFVENIGKEYKINKPGNRRAFPTFREDLMNLIQFPLWVKSNTTRNTIWALKDVSFEVRKGEVLGIIGRNGSGKSTLLKILAGITKPTTGFAEIFGRTGSLLEVGTGFHTELTGRDNIFISGNILGMSRAEIKQKFDQIVAFSEMEKFIDTPVKRYSSGMRVRLGFSVAAFLEPEILLLDEVLAVGDASFRRKSLEKIQEITGEGRTVLFVSHNMSAVKFVCDQTIILNDGLIKFYGPTEEAVKLYLVDQDITNWVAFVDLSNTGKRLPKCEKVFQSIRLIDENGKESTNFYPLSDITFEVSVIPVSEPIKRQDIHIAILDTQNTRMAILKSLVMAGKGFDIDGRMLLRCTWKDCPLAPGNYTVSLLTKGIQQIYHIDHIDNAISFQINPFDPTESEAHDLNPGVIIPQGMWEVINE